MRQKVMTRRVSHVAPGFAPRQAKDLTASSASETRLETMSAAGSSRVTSPTPCSAQCGSARVLLPNAHAGPTPGQDWRRTDALSADVFARRPRRSPPEMPTKVAEPKPTSVRDGGCQFRRNSASHGREHDRHLDPDEVAQRRPHPASLRNGRVRDQAALRMRARLFRRGGRSRGERRYHGSS